MTDIWSIDHHPSLHDSMHDFIPSFMRRVKQKGGCKAKLDWNCNTQHCVFTCECGSVKQVDRLSMIVCDECDNAYAVEKQVPLNKLAHKKD